METNFATELGKEFAEQLNNCPQELQNWDRLTEHDQLPNEDYLRLREYYGDVNSDVERWYRAGFNGHLNLL